VHRPAALGVLFVGRAKVWGEIYVATGGNDSWSGRQAQADGRGKDGPLATLGAALEASRKEGGTSRRIVLGPGRHHVPQTVVLDDRDAG